MIFLDATVPFDARLSDQKDTSFIQSLVAGAGLSTTSLLNRAGDLFKLLAGALTLRPGRRVILTEAGNFPSDIYMAEGLAHLTGDVEVRLAGDVVPAIDEDVAVVMLTHVDYRSAALHDMAAVTAAAHAKGALMLWDLSHSAGALPVELGEADFAVGCGYKFLNGGPGAPAYLFVATGLQEQLRNPIAGWFGHAAPSAFEPEYRPADGIARPLAGTPHVLSLMVRNSNDVVPTLRRTITAWSIG